MRTLEDLKNTLHTHKKELYNKYGVTQIGIFGSYIKNIQDESSDLDILVEFKQAIDLFTFVNLKNYLSDMLNINVDLVMKKALKSKISQRILEDTIYI
jgi:predicted nucleotidyltransferase